MTHARRAIEASRELCDRENAVVRLRKQGYSIERICQLGGFPRLWAHSVLKYHGLID
jgi:hypothetical protein